jgi:heme oxygenase (biliverdin-producing, ferredoxin)
MSGSRLSTRLREETQTLHRAAEQSGVMHELLTGRLDARVYSLLLRNLHAIYEPLEGALDRHAASALVAPVRIRALFRATALREDLEYLYGNAWTSLAIAGATSAYVARLEEISRDQPALLSAHAYVRYMGDLSGGQLLRDIVRRAFALDEKAGTAFYRFPEGVDAQVMKEQFRAAIDDLPVDAAGARAIIDEARSAFERHSRLFEELSPTE